MFLTGEEEIRKKKLKDVGIGKEEGEKKKAKRKKIPNTTTAIKKTENEKKKIKNK